MTPTRERHFWCSESVDVEGCSTRRVVVVAPTSDHSELSGAILTGFGSSAPGPFFDWGAPHHHEVANGFHQTGARRQQQQSHDERENADRGVAGGHQIHA